MIKIKTVPGLVIEGGIVKPHAITVTAEAVENTISLEYNGVSLKVDYETIKTLIEAAKNAKKL